MTKFDFPKEKGLETYSAIYVPSTRAKSIPISRRQHEKRASEVRDFMTRTFGGTTSVRAIGSYKFEEKNKEIVVKEPVIIVENFSDFSDYKKHDQQIRAFVEEKAKEWEQVEVSYEFESQKKPRRLVFVKAREDTKRKLKDIS
jgi:hypothetical protein